MYPFEKFTEEAKTKDLLERLAAVRQEWIDGVQRG
jgi:hypothetical protein